ncbi:MAG: TIGR04283 family arsenosugar biosynthesis glycosyltransferase [Gemmatimonadales bacterium]|nr:TIGR04283 family arsenosugar biosynthesis glycosyltransferase [Gemmatimonadales bacterium]
MPALDEAEGIGAVLAALAPLRARGHEVIVVDGGSRDDTSRVAAPLADRVLVTPRGRARQQNAGAAVARGDVLLFLHADTVLPDGADRLVLQALARPGRAWGRFDIRIEGRAPVLRLVAALMNLRSRWSGIATGDQAIFVRRSTFEAVGGFPAIELMEDVALSARLRRVAPPACLRERVVTSGRRWEARGPLRTIGLMWSLRLRYALGESPASLRRRYEGA